MGSRTLSSYTNTVKKDASQLEEPAVDDPSKAFVQPDERVKTGIRGLDEILGGGLPAHRLYLIQGAPGTGKTTLAMQFLFEAVLLGQPALYVTLSETKEELLQAARSHGWSLDGITFHELEKSPESAEPDGAYTFYHPAEVELGETTERVCKEVDRLKPTRVVFDSLSEMRLLAQDPLRYRRQILALKNFFTHRQCTVLLLDDRTTNRDDLQLQTIAHGVFSLENTPTDYGTTARRLLILKMRGVALQEGYHDFEIITGGLRVYPRLNAAAERPHGTRTGTKNISSGIAEMDKLLAGGMESGTSVLIIGPSGSGKSSLATQYVWQTVKQKERVACYLFEESRRSFMTRSEGQGMNLQPHIDRGDLVISQIDPSKLSPGEFAFRVKEEVEKKKASVILIDSLNGYLNAMPSERYLVIQMYELLTYLSDHGVLTLLILAQHGPSWATMSRRRSMSAIWQTPSFFCASLKLWVRLKRRYRF
jgi:circadian clock protein KaiC